MRRIHAFHSFLTVFFAIQLLIIFSQAAQSTIDAYTIYHQNVTYSVPLLRLLAHNIQNDPYLIFSGLNTGYGFYGIKTSTEKFFRATYYNEFGEVIESDRYFNTSTSNATSRLKNYASYLANYIAENKRNSLLNNIGFNRDEQNPEFRKDYVEKALKWLGKEQAAQIPNCASYRVELITLVPINLPDSSNPLSKPKYHVIQEGLYRVE